MNASDSRVWIVIPAWNESSIIGDVVRAVLARQGNVVVVDDGSSDSTAVTARDAGALVLRHAINRGQGAALQTGITYALRRGAGFIVTFDSDGQHEPDDIPSVVGPLLRGEADIALGSRFIGSTEAMPRSRRALLKVAVVFTRVVSGIRATDTHNGFRAFSRRAAEKIEIRLDRMAHASELLDQIRNMGLPWVEVPVRIRYTSYSKAKGQRASHAVRILLDYLIGRITR